MAPVVLFFFVVFLLIGLMFKLFVSRYEIEFSAFANAAVSALIIGKVIALMDLAESRYAADRTHRRIVVVAAKTFLYASVVIVLGTGEKIFHAYRKAGSLGEAVSNLIANANVDRFLGLVLLISVVVFVYFAVQEIEQAMGQGAMFRLFFKRGRGAGQAARQSRPNTTVVQVSGFHGVAWDVSSCFPFSLSLCSLLGNIVP